MIVTAALAACAAWVWQPPPILRLFFCFVGGVGAGLEPLSLRVLASETADDSADN
jgi:hypothetical protein